MQNRKKSLLTKIRSRGVVWLFARLLQETHHHTSRTGKLLKPLMYVLYWFVMLPINRVKSISQKKSISNNILYLFYDLEVSPVTFNFGWALALAELERKKKGLDFVQVVFVPGKKGGLREEDAEYEEKINYLSRVWRCHEVLHAMCHLLPSCVGVMACSGRNEANILWDRASPNVFPKQYNVVFPIAHTTSEVLFYEFQALDIMVLRATEQSLRYIEQWLQPRLKNRKLVTITLRQSSYMPARNSNLAAWAEFARSLDPEEYFVVFVPDTDVAFEETPECLTEFYYFNVPCWNLNLRAALYELSYLNLGVNNGTMGLCWLNEKCRYITFKMLVPEVPQTTEKALRMHGFKIGASLPFAGRFQKWVWQDDKIEIIKHEFNLMCDLIEREINNEVDRIENV